MQNHLMGKNKILTVISVLFLCVLVVGQSLVGVAMLREETEKNLKETTTENAQTTEQVTEQTTDLAEQTTTEEITTAEAAEPQVVLPTTTEDFQQMITTMKAGENVETEQYNTLLRLAQIVVKSEICDEEGVILSRMSDEKKSDLDFAIGDAVFTDNLYGGIMAGQLYIDDEFESTREEVQALVQEIYQCSEIPDVEDSYLDMTDDGYVKFLFCNPETGLEVGEGAVKEMDSYYLFSAPYFNHSYLWDKSKKGNYVDILFEKNENSRFGVSAIYAQYYSENKEVVSVDTTSELGSQEGKSYAGMNLVDGNYETAWVEGVSGVGEGESVTLHLAAPTQLFGVIFYNGYLASEELYEKNGRVTRVLLDFGNEVTMESDVASEMEVPFDESQLDYGNTVISLDSPVVTDTVTITILDAVSGDEYDDTCISELILY
jgi:hypothetical protein